MDATFDYQRWQIANRTRNQHQAQRIAARLTRARTLVTQIVQELVAVDPHLTRVVLFGSVARGNPHGEYFDIDIAVVGAQRFGALFAVAERYTVDHSIAIDLLEMEGLKEGVATAIRRDGEELYAKN